MSDEYATDAVVRWGDDGQVSVFFELQGSAYGFTTAPEIFDEMHLGDVDYKDATEAQAPVVMQLLSFPIKWEG